ncbi:hypothetical protein [Glutamicibacter sp. NPDC087344]|uniref:hypothetical protein n=1 Tax=Glutamicibacter sp. NPDC087344 TaxID=3363994 RepID=UPI0038301F50
MTSERIAGSEDAAKRLSATSLREFLDPITDTDKTRRYRRYRRSVSRDEIALPGLVRYALKLVGLSSFGPGEKVAWWVNFLFQGRQCELAFEKFGLRLYIEIVDNDEADVIKVGNKIVKKLGSSMRAVESLVLAPAAPGLFHDGKATVVNQHMSLRRSYEYFRNRASSPFLIEDEVKHLENGGTTFQSGKRLMQMNSFHDLVASVNAYLSLLEHILVLALPFQSFNPSKDSLEKFIGSRWGDKYGQVFDLTRKDDKRYYDRLIEVVERWRNTYSHGGFEKGHGSSVYLHYEGIGAIPVGLSSATERVGIFFMPATDEDINHVFKLFDEIDAWFTDERMHFAMEWITSGLHVRFDPEFRAELVEAMESPERFSEYVEYTAYLDDRTANMDY